MANFVFQSRAIPQMRAVTNVMTDRKVKAMSRGTQSIQFFKILLPEFLCRLTGVGAGRLAKESGQRNAARFHYNQVHKIPMPEFLCHLSCVARDLAKESGQRNAARNSFNSVSQDSLTRFQLRSHDFRPANLPTFESILVLLRACLEIDQIRRHKSLAVIGIPALRLVGTRAISHQLVVGKIQERRERLTSNLVISFILE